VIKRRDGTRKTVPWESLGDGFFCVLTCERAFTYLESLGPEKLPREVKMLFLMMFVRKIKGGPRTGYARIYNTRPYPLGIRSMTRHKGRPLAKEQSK